MKKHKTFQRLGGLAVLAALTAFVAGCMNDSSSSSTDDSLLSSGGNSGGDDSGGSGGSGSGGSEFRIEAELEPQINVDASGKARLRTRSGSDERLDSEIEIDARGFGAVSIDAGDGFTDETVQLVVTRGGNELFSTGLKFSEDRRVNGMGDITFESDRRSDIPDLRVGDVARVRVNGVALLEGTFVED